MSAQHIFEMAKLQKQLNDRISDNWTGNNHLRAAIHEMVEMQDHIGWKWWKKQEPNVPQAKIELVDAWHFMLSHWLVQSQCDPERAAHLAWHSLTDPQDFPLYTLGQFRIMSILDQIDMFVGTMATGRLYGILFAGIAQSINMPIEELHKVYVGKNVLNMFRQDHGYKQGTYLKTWFGQEDNVHLDTLIVQTPGDITAAQLYEDLKGIYERAKDFGEANA